MQQDAEVDRNFFSRRLLGKAKEVGDEIAGAPGLIHDLAQELVLFVGEVFLGPELLGVTYDSGQRMINLVGRAGHEVAERSKLLL